ncbi:hypothetical protein D3C80_799970 [compost metagenome]
MQYAKLRRRRHDHIAAVGSLTSIPNDVDAERGELTLIQQVIIGRHPFRETVRLVKRRLQGLCLKRDLPGRQQMLPGLGGLFANDRGDSVNVGPTRLGLAWTGQKRRRLQFVFSRNASIGPSRRHMLQEAWVSAFD